MTVSLTPLADLSASQLTAWADLAGRAAEPNPFFEPDFAMPASRFLGADRVALLTVERGGEWLACAPVRRQLGGPVATLTVWKHLYCYLGTPLVDAASVAPAAEELLSVLDGRDPRLLGFEAATSDGPVMGAIAGAMEARGCDMVFERAYERPVLHRPPPGERVGVSRRKAADLRRQGRRLGEVLGEAVELTEHSDDEAALDRFLALESSGWKGRGGSALGSDNGHAAFFREVCGRFARAGRLRLLALGSEQRPVAMSCDFVAGDTLFCFKMGFDEQYARYSPGIQLLQANAEAFRDTRTERCLDSCADPGNTLMAHMWPDRRQLTTSVVAKAGPRASLLRAGLNAALAMRGRGREALDRAQTRRATRAS